MPSPLTLPVFIAKWRASKLTERSAAQSHFIDLCQVLGQDAPSSDPTGESYTFEKGVSKSGGGDGWADVWKRGLFGWEYKGPRKDLGAAYQQLLQYREALENPPLLVVCDLDSFQVHTNFTATRKLVYSFRLDDLASPDPLPGASLSALEVLRAVFEDPARLRPQQTPAEVTEKAATEFARLADALRRAGADPERSARFLMRLLFCLFAEDIDLLPPRLFSRLVESTRSRPEEFGRRLAALFAAMAEGGAFGVEDIKHFNGGLFADAEVLPLTSADLEVLQRASRLNWANVEPAIFGTLFERSLDPAKRSQLGAHYTSREDILLIVEPVLMAPLRREWDEVQEKARELVARARAAKGKARTRHEEALRRLLIEFAGRVAAVRVLDPACGSGNFLYVALKELMELEREVIAFAASEAGQSFFPQVSPTQLHGIEVSPYAHELAQVVVWIGYIQWLRDNGFGVPDHPILKALGNIRQMDAIIGRDKTGKLIVPEWPEADVIVGNPPFLGGKRLRSELGDAYVDDLFRLYDGQVAREADLVVYWYERARGLVESDRVKRVGLLATNSIRGGANRRTLERIKGSGDIFMAWSDREWVLDGAAVRVSMVGFDGGGEATRFLDGKPVATINADLTSALDLTRAERLTENLDIAFQGPVKVGQFEMEPHVAEEMLAAPPNINGRPNSDVLRPWVNGMDVTRRPRGMFIVDFGDMPVGQAAEYELPFEYVRQFVKPFRDQNRDRQRRENWWRLGRSGSDLKSATRGLSRMAATPRVAKHRLFVWLSGTTLPDSRVFVFARDDDYFFGVLQSHAHEVWSLATCSWHGVGDDPTYNTSTCFETYPFPWPPGREPVEDARVLAVAEAARDLVAKRDAWLNPPGSSEAELAKRTLTSLYNARPSWLRLAHERLDRAVLDAYVWPHDLSDDEILERLLDLNRRRAGRT